MQSFTVWQDFALSILVQGTELLFMSFLFLLYYKSTVYCLIFLFSIIIRLTNAYIPDAMLNKQIGTLITQVLLKEKKKLSKCCFLRQAG